jgi:hypothetical protein
MGFKSALPVTIPSPAQQPAQHNAQEPTWSPIGEVLGRKSAGRLIATAEENIQAAHDQIEIVRASHGNENEKVKLCAPIGGFLQRAADAAKAITSNEATRLTEAVEHLALDLTHLNQALGLPTRLKWHKEFAAAFDGETVLRRALLLPVMDRRDAYSGVVDPQDAFTVVQSLVGNAEKGTHESRSALVPTDPFTAVTLIESRLLFAYDYQMGAVRRFVEAIDVDWPPSLGDILTSIVGDALVAVASDGVGALVERGLKATVFKGTQAAAKEVAGHASDHNPALDLAKAGLKDLAVGAAKRGAESAKAVTGEKASIVFGAALQRAILDSKQAANERMANVTPALAQLDFEMLLALFESLGDLNNRVDKAMTHAAHIQWQNWKAYSARSWPAEWKQHPQDPNLNAPSASRFGDQPIPGVLEVGVSVNPDPEFSYLVIRDAEPAAVEHFRGLDVPIASLKLNRQYQFSFDGLASAFASSWAMPPSVRPATYVKLGIGVKEGFQRGTLSAQELLTLKLYRAGYKPDELTRMRAELDHLVDHISDDAALETVRALVDAANHTTTSKLERG